MTKELKKLRQNLKSISRAKNIASRETGCCKIFLGGSTSRRSGITERECKEVAADFPGATYSFQAGVVCS